MEESTNIYQSTKLQIEKNVIRKVAEAKKVSKWYNLRKLKQQRKSRNYITEFRPIMTSNQIGRNDITRTWRRCYNNIESE